MIKGLKKLHRGEPACQERSDSDHLRFVIHRKDDELFDFTIELNGIKSWTVPGVPSMNPLDQKTAKEDRLVAELILTASFEQTSSLQMWDKGNYIPIDDCGNALSEHEAIECLNEGILKFFLQGTKLVGEFVLMKKGKKSWLLMKRHDEFALYNNYNLETVAG
jgi:hypothetical protein